MGRVLTATRNYVASLGALDAYATVLAEAAIELAANVDEPPVSRSGAAESVAPFVNSLRATLASLKEAASADKGEDDGGWGEVLPLSTASG